MILSATGGLNLDRMRARMRLGKNEDWTFLRDSSIVRSLRLPAPGSGMSSAQGAPRLVRLIPDGDGVIRSLRVLTDARDADEEARLARAAAHCLSLDQDLTSFYACVEGDRRLAALARRYRGLRVLRDANLFESVIKSIIGQQVSVDFAGRLVHRLRVLAGEVRTLPSAWPDPEHTEGTATRAVPVFPTPDKIAALPVQNLTARQFSRTKAEYVIGFADAVASGRLDLDALARLPDEAFVAKLTALRGIGRWTAECALMFGLGRPDVLPAADLGLRKAVRHVFGLDDLPGEAQVRRLAEAWRPHRSLATLYLWETLRDAV